MDIFSTFKKRFIKPLVLFFFLVFIYIIAQMGQHFVPQLGLIANPMHAAIHYRSINAVKILSYTPFLNIPKHSLIDGCITPVEFAAVKGLKEIVVILMERNAKRTGCNTTVLHKAVNFPDIVEYLLKDVKINPDIRSDSFGNTALFGTLICPPKKSRVLYTNISGGFYTHYNDRIKSLALLLDFGADPNFSFYKSPTSTPLGRAVDNGCEEMVEMLLNKGADPGPVFEGMSKMYPENPGPDILKTSHEQREAFKLVEAAAKKQKN